MNIIRKTFFILIISLALVLPNISSAQKAPEVAKCIFKVDCAAMNQSECLKHVSDCNVSGVKCVSKSGVDCNGQTYGTCISKLYVGPCEWSGAIPVKATSTCDNTDKTGTCDNTDAKFPNIDVPKIDNPAKGVSSVQGLASNIINAIFGMIGSLALLMIIYGGLTWMTSGGNAENIKKGRDTVIWATIGLAFIFLSYALASVLIKTIT
ncbi:MAG: pilin [Patescibacteria group bacterium]